MPTGRRDAGANGGEQHTPWLEKLNRSAADHRIKHSRENRSNGARGDSQARVVTPQIQDLADRKADDHTDDDPTQYSEKHKAPWKRTASDASAWRSSDG